MLGFMIGLLIFIFFIIVILIDGNRFVIKEHTFESSKIKKDMHFAVLSDLHNKTYGVRNKRLLEAIEKIQPDGILIAGDMLTATPGKEFTNALNLIQDLAQKYPVYYANGNHEQRLRLHPEIYGTASASYTEALAGAGVRPIMNEHVFLNACHIDICGSEIERKYYRHLRKKQMDSGYLNRLLGTAKEEDYQILIAHNPLYFEEYAKWGADLVLSGHVHGGVMRLPFLGGVISPTLRLFPKYDGGIFRQGNSTMILSRGLGMHTIPIRIFNPGELIVLHLKRGEDI